MSKKSNEYIRIEFEIKANFTRTTHLPENDDHVK